MRVELVVEGGGGGHRVTARALTDEVARRGLGWEVREYDLIRHMDVLDVLYRVTGVHGDDIYNLLVLRRGWYWLYPLLLKIVKANVRQQYEAGRALVEQRFRQTEPDLVVSLTPFFTRVLADALRAARPGVPLVVVLTDFADSPPDFWFDARADCIYACPTQRAVQQARELGVPPERIVETSGMVLRPCFYEPPPPGFDRRAERRRLGLDPDRPTALALLGAEGGRAVLAIADCLSRVRPEVQAIFLCGRDQRVAARLGERLRRSDAIRAAVLGFTDDVAGCMRLADFFIGKPGALSVGEAAHMRLPLIVERHRWTLEQERYNANWVVEQDVGLQVRRFDEVDQAAQALLEPATLQRLRANLSRLQNRALFEVVDLLVSLSISG